MIIIDFDDTLFDTHRLKARMAKCATEVGILEDVFWQTYHLTRQDDKGIWKYSFKYHAKILGDFGYSQDDLYVSLEKLEKTLSTFVFIDTHEVLEELQNIFSKMVLLSLGDPKFQALKVSNAGVKKYFTHLYMVDDIKDKVIEQLIMDAGDESIWFVNDKVVETIRIARSFPQIKCILKVAPTQKIETYQQSNLPYFKTLEEIKNYVRSS